MENSPKRIEVCIVLFELLRLHKRNINFYKLTNGHGFIPSYLSDYEDVGATVQDVLVGANSLQFFRLGHTIESNIKQAQHLPFQQDTFERILRSAIELLRSSEQCPIDRLASKDATLIGVDEAIIGKSHLQVIAELAQKQHKFIAAINNNVGWVGKWGKILRIEYNFILHIERFFQVMCHRQIGTVIRDDDNLLKGNDTRIPGQSINHRLNDPGLIFLGCDGIEYIMCLEEFRHLAAFFGINSWVFDDMPHGEKLFSLMGRWEDLFSRNHFIGYYDSYDLLSTDVLVIQKAVARLNDGEPCHGLSTSTWAKKIDLDGKTWRCSCLMRLLSLTNDMSSLADSMNAFANELNKNSGDRICGLHYFRYLARCRRRRMLQISDRLNYESNRDIAWAAFDELRWESEESAVFDF